MYTSVINILSNRLTDHEYLEPLAECCNLIFGLLAKYCTFGYFCNVMILIFCIWFLTNNLFNVENRNSESITLLLFQILQ